MKNIASNEVGSAVQYLIAVATTIILLPVPLLELITFDRTQLNTVGDFTIF